MEHNEPEHNDQLQNKNSEGKQYLITDQNYNLIKEYQTKIYTETESTPSIRKIINELITEENLKKVKSKFISIWKM